jgi:hypothetical protein
MFSELAGIGKGVERVVPIAPNGTARERSVVAERLTR